jgi:2-oxoglutarate dehydrogenase E2 component (dihydrolipoamide succinyltransferase)
MSIEIRIPKVGESISEVQISEWLKAAGDSVAKDEPLVVIDSEKTTFELPASDSGTLTKILHQAGETVSVGSVIGQLEPGAGPGVATPSGNAPRKESKPPLSPPPSPPAQAAPAPQKSETPASASPPALEARPATTRVPGGVDSALTPEEEVLTGQAEDNQRKAADSTLEAEAQSESIKPASAPAPRIVSSRPAPTRAISANGEEEAVPMTMLRRTVARRLVEAKQSMAMLTTFNEVDMSAVQELRKGLQEAFRERHGTRLGLMAFFVKAAIGALKQFPQLNAEVRGNDIVYRNYFDIGVALASERGLVVPVLRKAERLSFAEIEKEIAEFARRAKSTELKPGDLEGGTFTITNGGVFGSLLSTPIINPPQSGILGLHAIEDRPVARDGQVVIRPMMYLALTYDHRIVDGREAVLFLRRIREAVESPARMLIEA